MPLRSQTQILSFFERHPKHIFITNCKIEDEEIFNRVKYNYYFNKYTRRSGYSDFIVLTFKILNKISLKLQRIFKVNNIQKFNLKVSYASNWVSLDQDTVNLILKNKLWIDKVFKHSSVSDELFIPTLLNNFPIFKKKIYKIDFKNDTPEELQGNMRYINFWDGSPYTFKDGDEDQLNHAIKEGHLFARKFDLHNNLALKRFIINKVKE